MAEAEKLNMKIERKFIGFFVHPFSSTCDKGRMPYHSIDFKVEATDYEKAREIAAKIKPTCTDCGARYQLNDIMG